MKKKNLIFIFAAILSLSLLLLNCSDKDKPPFIKAEITDAAGNKTVVNHFRLLYWWEERNETPYLKPHDLYTKELIAVIMTPLDNNPKRVKISTEKFPLPDLKSITILAEATGYELSINTKSGEKVTASNQFPRSLKKDKDSGIADNLLYAYGKVMKNNREEEFKKCFNILKEIKILEVKTVKD